MLCEYCGKLFEGRSYGGHKVNCKEGPKDKLRVRHEKLSKAAKDRVVTDYTRSKISSARITYLKNNPDKVPYKLNHRYKETYPEQYFKNVLLNYVYQYRVPDTLYCADFANPNNKVIIEIDGEQHYVDSNIVKHDIKRGETLESLGWTIIRVRWAHFCKMTRESKESIITNLNSYSPTPVEPVEVHVNRCVDCKCEISKSANRCNKCNIATRENHKFTVTFEELSRLVESTSMLEVGRIFGVSSNAIKKRCKKLGVPLVRKKYGD